MSTKHKYKCVICPESFKIGKRLDEHCQNVHDNASEKCGKCLQRFLTTEDLKKHEKDSHEISCQYCIRVFPTDGILKIHQ